MSYVSHTSGPSRCFDHVYDPIFEVSSQKDVWKANVQALQRSAPIQITSVFQTMFSDIPNRPGFIRWKRQNALPHFTYPQAKQPKSDYALKTKQRKQFCVEGSSRYNFFHYPPGYVKTLNVQLSPPAQCKSSELTENKYENAACQTKYRESSAQTRPYEPDFRILDGEVQTPEVIRVANYIREAKSPGELETNLIERLRKRRHRDKELPPTISANECEMRQTLLGAFEWEEFLAREEGIQEMQELRMELVRDVMARREFSMRSSSTAKLDHAVRRKENERKEKLRKLKNKFNRQLRKLEYSRTNFMRKYKAQNIVKEHVDRASDLYAPQMRFGVHPKRLHYVPFDSSFQARLENLDTSKIESKKLKCSIQKYDLLATPKPLIAEVLKGFSSGKHLTKLYEALLALRTTPAVNTNHPTCLQNVHKEQDMAAETPLGSSEDLYESSKARCSIYVQKILKGRAIQKLLYSGRDRCRGLIREIQTTRMLSAVSAMYPTMSNNTTRSQLTIHSHQKNLTQKIRQEKQRSDIFRDSEAGLVGILLEFLEKELRRMYEQRQVHAFCILAERERMKREAAEAGRRQTENRRRQETEQVYKHSMNFATDTVSLYLENLLVEETDEVAEGEARKQIKAIAKFIDHEICESKGSKCELVETNETDGTDQTINDLVKQFMFLEVRKKIARKNMEELRRRRHLLAAHEGLYGRSDTIFYKPPPRSSRSVTISHTVSPVVDKVLSSETVLSKIGRNENLAQHEALAVIRKIIKNVFSDGKGKDSAEHVAIAAVNEIINHIFEEKPQETNLSIQRESCFRHVIKLLSSKFCNSILDAEVQTKNDGGSMKKNNLEEILTLFFAEYGIDGMDADRKGVEDNESVTYADSKDFFLPLPSIEPEYFDIDSSSEGLSTACGSESVNTQSIRNLYVEDENQLFPPIPVASGFRETAAAMTTNPKNSRNSHEIPGNDLTKLKSDSTSSFEKNEPSV